jgi:lipopolysaccharide transport system permease protein
MNKSPSISPLLTGTFGNSATEPIFVIQPRRHLLSLDIKGLWEYRELLYFLIWRDLKVRYRQSVIGIGWVILQPLMTMVVFSTVFGKFVGVPSDGLPYPIFIFSALLPWNLFASSLTRGSGSVVDNSQLVSKIYFPRLILPLSGVLSPMADFAVAFVILIGMMMWFGILPSVTFLAVPLFLLLATLTALAIDLWLSALNVRYRDVMYAVPFLVQSWMFVTPVTYPVSLVPEKWRLLYSLNPMAGVVEGFRWALLGKQSPDFLVIIASAVMMVGLLVSGMVYFRYTERTFADVI